MVASGLHGKNCSGYNCSLLYLFFFWLVDLMKEGSTVVLRNAKIDMFKGSMRLAVDKWGRVEVTEPASFSVKEDNNLSLVEYELVNVVEEWLFSTVVVCFFTPPPTQKTKTNLTNAIMYWESYLQKISWKFTFRKKRYGYSNNLPFYVSGSWWTILVVCQHMVIAVEIEQPGVETRFGSFTFLFISGYLWLFFGYQITHVRSILWNAFQSYCIFVFDGFSMFNSSLQSHAPPQLVSLSTYAYLEIHYLL